MAQRDETSQSVKGTAPTSPSITQNTPGAQRAGNGESDDLDAVKAEAGRQFDHVRHRAQADLETARDRATGFANEQKDYAASQLSGIAGAVRKVADELPQDQAVVGHYARDIADGIDQLSGAARDQTVGDMIHSAESFGRRQPAAFLGAAVLLGFAASRFVVASSHRRPGNSASAVSRGDGGQSQQNKYGEKLHG